MLPRPIRPAMVPACLALALLAGAARAEDGQQPDLATGLWTRSNLLGDAGGVRSSLGSLGVTFGLQNIDEVWGNVSAAFVAAPATTAPP